jgi:hypothetical protein
VAAALGSQARHVLVPQAGHGVMSLACMRDAIFRFIDAEADADALKVDVSCAAALPRPPAYLPVSDGPHAAAAAAAAAAGRSRR